MSDAEMVFWRSQALELEKEKQETTKAIKEFLRNPIGRNKEKLADLIGTNILGETNEKL